MSKGLDINIQNEGPGEGNSNTGTEGTVNLDSNEPIVVDFKDGTEGTVKSNEGNEGDSDGGNSNGDEPVEFSFDSYLAKKLNAPEGKITTGSADNPVQLEISELNDKQKVALLEHHYRQLLDEASADNNTEGNENDLGQLATDEVDIITRLRKGELQSLYEELGKELNYTGNSQWSDNDFLTWKIRQQYPSFDDEQVARELDDINTSELKDAKVEAAKAEKAEFDQAQLNAAEEKLQEDAQKAHEALVKEYEDISENLDVESLLGFQYETEEREELLSESLRDLFEKDDEGDDDARLIKYLKTPQGLFQTAVVLNNYPKVMQFMLKLENENQALRAQVENKGEGRVNLLGDGNEEAKEGEIDFKNAFS